VFIEAGFMTRYIFLSPHLDDVVLSCGAIVDHLTSSGHQAEIWTLFAGDPPHNNFSPFALSLHRRWALPDNPVSIRRMEDVAACEILHATPQHFDIPDCIYRYNGDAIPLITKEEDLYQSIPSQQMQWVDYIYQLLQPLLPETRLVAPISIGDHVDHRIVRAAVDKLSNRQILFYRDYPYHIKENDRQYFRPLNAISSLQFEINQRNIDQWIKAIRCHKSQISTFWQSETHLAAEIQNYARAGGGQSLTLMDKTVTFS
jgi:LmbE family N-acetylglucosaminyl deacetylase